MKSVKSIIREHLQKINADGLCYPYEDDGEVCCYCHVATLMQCDCTAEHCVPAVYQDGSWIPLEGRLEKVIGGV